MSKLIPRAAFPVLTALFSSTALAQGSSVLVEQMGKFHFLVLHFPVVLITLLPVVAIVSLLPFGYFWRKTIPYFLHLGTLSAIVTTVFGFFELSQRQAISNGLKWHQYGGYAVTGFMVLFSLIFLAKKPKLEKHLPVALIAAAVVAAGLVTLSAHLGGESVHGKLFILLGGEE